MKKNLALLFISSTLFMSSCSNDEIINTPVVNQNQVQSKSQKTQNSINMSQQEIEKLINENKSEIEKVAKIIFMTKFADEAEVANFTRQNAFINPAFKGGAIFNLLNKSEFAQKLLKGIGNYAVKKKFSKPDTPDNFPLITAQETDELLKVLKAGDIILCGIDDSFIHSIIYAGNGIIIHSLGSPNPKFWGTIKEPLTTYFKRSNRDKFVVLRYTKATQEDINKAIEFADKQVGKPYDSLFLINDDNAFYCTELVFRALMNMNTPPKIYPHKEKFGWELIANEDFMDSPDLETIWTLHRDRNPAGKLNKY
ncbi:MAG: YiiX/YebB-like N1pC/P60 family cysteine hydrolase [Candidatus Sericytochromatia bacterium]